MPDGEVLGSGSVPGGIHRPWEYRKNKQTNSRRKRYRCKEIRSWNAAQELLREGHSYLDRDKDGEACESLK
ncbi:excalibur calcium-binding domain-containing protein [Prochlorococcus marinus]|uniref:excalibur calcium-binding domain-containing protein n=1 Tax=Prochlorococcus marinus TaxID=1219 RepID=UPI001F278434|nr:excalibur calcium-binding domain-containing protein [Prochlorococcus marinus]